MAPPADAASLVGTMDARIAKCLLVSKILVADGIVSENEQVYLAGMMKRLGLTEAEQKRVLDLEGWNEAEAALTSLPEDDRRAIIGELVDAASADGRLGGLEAAAVKRITAALGFV